MNIAITKENFLKYYPIWITAVTGTTLGIFLVFYIAGNKHEMASSRFTSTANKITDEISDNFEHSVSAIHHLSSFYSSSEHVTHSEFQAYVSSFIKHSPEIHSLQWIPKITHQQRAQHEAEQSILKPGYRITEQSDNNILAPANARKYYYPITYIYPLHNNKQVLGYDMASNPMHKNMLEQAISTNTIAVTNKIPLIQQKDNTQTILIALPVIRAREQTRPSANNNIIGFVSGRFITNKIFNDIINKFEPNIISMTVNEVKTTDTTQALYKNIITSRQGRVFLANNTIRVANQKWQVIIEGNPTQFGAMSLIEHIMALAICLGFTTLISAYIHLLRCSQQQAQKISQQLTLEINTRVQYEKMLVDSNMRLETLSREDPLTKIANRRGFDEYLSHEWRRAQRSGFPLSLIIADIDNFKAFNDKYGHVIGDHCLREVANVFSEVANRPSDLAARYGGEEIAVILPETFDEGAMTVAENICKAIYALSIPHEDSITAPVVTISIGVTTIINVKEYTTSEIIHAADDALYTAKLKGKNQVVQICPGEHRPDLSTEPKQLDDLPSPLIQAKKA